MENVDWQLACRNVKERGRRLLSSGQWADCTFSVGSDSNRTQMKGHRLMLAMASPVFEAMFFGGLPERDEPIAILDVQPEAFGSLLEYVYSDTVVIESFDKACELCYAAKKYMLPHLVQECTNFLWSDLRPGNACRAYEFAKLFEEPVLMDKCLEIVRTQTPLVLSEGGLEDAEPETLLKILEQDDLNVESELELFEAAARYAAAASAASRPPHPAVRGAVQKIRFLTLSPQQFAEGPARSELLTRDEAFAILMNISSPKSDRAMPEGFSACTRPRKRSRRSATPTPPPHLHAAHVTPVLEIPDADRHHCRRQFFHEMDCLNTSVLDSSLTFTVDRNVCIGGVQIPTQVQGKDPSAPYNPDSSYTELLYAHLLDSDNSRLTYTHYTSRVRYGRLLDVAFNRPVYVQRNKVYKVDVVFNKFGWYPIGTGSNQTVECEGVRFNFCVGQGGSVRDGLIRSVVFNH